MIPVRVFAPFAFGYFLSYLYRSVNAVAGTGITADLGIDQASLGLLTSAYFLTFAAVQLPLGVVLDRWPAHKVEAGLLTIAAAGAALFAVGGDVGTLTLGRALIGLGVSACLMAAFKAYASLVPIEKLPLVNGLHLAIGGLGLFAGGWPSEFAMGLVGWRGLFWLLAALSLLAAALLLVFGATPRAAPGRASIAEQFREVGRILTSRPFLAIAPVTTAAQMTALSLQSLWAGPWLRDVAGFSPRDASLILSVMAAATTLGFVFGGTLGAALARRGVPVSTGAVAGITLFALTQPVILFAPVPAAVVAWVGFAFFATISMLSYPALTGAFPRELSGRVNTALNFVVFVSAFVTQGAVGYVVDATKPALGLGGAYTVAFGILLVLQVAGLAWFLVRRERAAAPAQA